MTTKTENKGRCGLAFDYQWDENKKWVDGLTIKLNQDHPWWQKYGYTDEVRDDKGRVVESDRHFTAMDYMVFTIVSAVIKYCPEHKEEVLGSISHNLSVLAQ